MANNRQTRPKLYNKGRTPLVDQLCICCTTSRTTKSTTSLQLIDSCTTSPQHSTKPYSLLYNKSTTNPQLIEQVQFGLKPSYRRRTARCCASRPTRCKQTWTLA